MILWHNKLVTTCVDKTNCSEDCQECIYRCKSSSQKNMHWYIRNAYISFSLDIIGELLIHLNDIHNWHRKFTVQTIVYDKLYYSKLHQYETILINMYTSMYSTYSHIFLLPSYIVAIIIIIVTIVGSVRRKQYCDG